MLVQNQKPTEISIENIKINPSNDFDLAENVLENFTKPLMTPLSNKPVEILMDNKPIDLEEFTSIMIDETYNNGQPNKDELNECFDTTIIRYEGTKELTINEIFLNQSAKKEKLPFPVKSLAKVVAYTIKDDILPSIKEIMANQGSYDKLFTAIGFTARPNTLGVYFKNEDEFNEFRESFINQTQMIKGQLSVDTNALCNQLSMFKLDVPLECIQLRSEYEDQNEELSFARLLHTHIFEYLSLNQDRNVYGVLPFSFSELFIPRSITFFNLERHLRVNPNTLSKYYKDLEKGLSVRPKILNNRKIRSLTKWSRNLNKLQNSQVPITSKDAEVMRAKRVPFSTEELTVSQITKRILKEINKMTNVNKSHNISIKESKTYNRPNRRDPDNPNKKGLIKSKEYKPDIHIYCDTSGSISEVNYQDAIKTCIAIARKLNINLYFTSFSTVLSKDALLKLKNRTKQECYRNFEKLPKVTGGTDYMPIYSHINENGKRRKRLNIIITDFEYYPPSHYFKHPKNLVYLPCSKMDMDVIKRNAEYFVKSMEHVDPRLRRKILF